MYLMRHYSLVTELDGLVLSVMSNPRSVPPSYTISYDSTQPWEPVVHISGENRVFRRIKGGSPETRELSTIAGSHLLSPDILTTADMSWRVLSELRHSM